MIPEGDVTLVDCPSCGTPIALLPSSSYTSTEGVEPGEITDPKTGERDAVFAIVDASGKYTCPACGRDANRAR